MDFIKETNFYHLVCIVLFVFTLAIIALFLLFNYSLYNIILVTVYNLTYIFSSQQPT